MNFASLFAVSALNSIWQSALLAGAVAVFLRVQPRTAAAQRYVIWSTVLFACFALPVANMLLPARNFVVPAPALSALQSDPGAVAGTPRTSIRSNVRSSHTPLRVTREVPASGTQPAAPSLLARLPRPAAIAFTLWAIIAGFLVLRLFIGYVRLNRVRRTLDERPLDRDELVACARMTSRTVRVGYSNTVSTPCVVGLGEATIVLPDVLAEGLTKSDLLRILRHECAHIRRFDDYGNLAQQVLRAILFFNPVIYLVSRALDVDREVACDDAVELAEAERVEFAKCLYDIARHNLRRPWMPATGFVRYRSHISLRISQLLDRNHNGSTRIGASSALTVAAILSLVFPLGLMQLRAGAQQAQPAIRAAAAAPTIAAHQAHAEAASARIAVAAPAVRATAQAIARATAAAIATAAPLKAQLIAAHAATAQWSVAKVVAQKSQLKADVVKRMVAQNETDLVAQTHDDSSDDFLNAVSAAGFHNLSANDLIEMRNAGVTAECLHAFAAAGLMPMSVRDVIRLENSGVTSDYMAGIRAEGLTSVSARDLIRLANAGVTPEFIRHIKQSVLANPSVEDLIRLRNAGV